MLNERFDELARKPDAKFLGAGVGDGGAQPGRRRRSRSARASRTARSTTALGVARDRGAARARVRLQRRRARSRQAVDGGVLRARLQRARQDRERLVRAGIRQLLPRTTSRAPASTTSTSWSAAAADDHRGGSRRRWRGRCCGDDSRVDPGDLAAEAGHQGADRSRTAGGARRGDGGAVTPWTDTHRDARADGTRAGSRRRRLAPRDRRPRRHRRPLRQRRRSVAEADRLQERSGPVHAERAGRLVARAAGRLPEASLATALRRACPAPAG